MLFCWDEKTIHHHYVSFTCLGYFAQLTSIDVLSKPEAFHIQLPNSWGSWFYLRPRQLLLFFQDSTHLVTKLRNRMLSSTTRLIIGGNHISLRHLEDIILNYAKIDHNLVMSDLYVTDRQNYASCVKISSFDVLNILKKNENMLGTHFYLSIIRFVIMAYIDRSTNVKERIYFAWCSVFLCRFWWIWLQKTFRSRKSSKMTIAKQFITEPAFFSIELNAQTLTYILLLVIDHQLPVESLNIYLFSSQPCENVFRSARSLSGSFSTMTNFTVDQFLRKSRRISILNEIKTVEQESTDSCAIKFPIHHKKIESFSSIDTSSDLNGLTIMTIEAIIISSYEYAKSVMNEMNTLRSLENNNLLTMENLSEYIRDHLQRTSRTIDHSHLDSDDNVDNNEKSLDQEDDQNISYDNENDSHSAPDDGNGNENRINNPKSNSSDICDENYADQAGDVNNTELHRIEYCGNDEGKTTLKDHFDKANFYHLEDGENLDDDRFFDTDFGRWYRRW